MSQEADDFLSLRQLWSAWKAGGIRGKEAYEAYSSQSAPVQAFREHEGEVNDEIDAARDYESEAGRDEELDPGERAFVWWAYVSLLAAVLIVVFWPA